MKQFGRIFSSVFSTSPLDPEAARRKEICREWDKQRRNASGPSDLAEIDEIFARAL